MSDAKASINRLANELVQKVARIEADLVTDAAVAEVLLTAMAELEQIAERRACYVPTWMVRDLQRL